MKNRLQGKKRSQKSDTPHKGNMQIVGQTVTTRSGLPRKGRKGR